MADQESPCALEICCIVRSSRLQGFQGSFQRDLVTSKAIIGILMCVETAEMEEKYKRMGSEGLKCAACSNKKCFLLSWIE